MIMEIKPDTKIERFSFAEFSGAVVAAASRKPPGKPGKKPEAPPPPPTFSEEQLKAAEQAAHRKGFLEGEKEGRKQAESEQAMVDRKLAELVEKFATRVAPLFENYRKTTVAIREQTPKVALAIARKVAGKALAEHAQGEVTDMALRCCETLLKEPKLTITVHESLGDTLARKLEQLAERLQSAADIVILRDPNLPAADFRIEWSQGTMERQTETLWQEVEKVMEDMAATATRDAKGQMETLQQEISKKDG